MGATVTAIDKRENIIGALEKGLEGARAGKLTAVVVACVQTDGSVLIHYGASMLADYFALSAAVARAQHDIQMTMDAENEVTTS